MRPTSRLLAPFLATLAFAGSLGLATAASAAPATGLPGFNQVVVDKAAGHIFVSEGAGNGLAVADLTGTLITTLDPGAGVNGIALSQDGTKLYAAISGSDAVAEIDAASLQQTALYPLASGDIPYWLAVQSGKVWVSYQLGTSIGTDGIGDITPGTTASFEADPSLTPSNNFWYDAPNLAADPSNSGTIIAVDEGPSPATVLSLDTSGTLKVLAYAHSFAGCNSSIATPAVMPGGSQFAVACAGPGPDVLYSAADLTAQPQEYQTVEFPDAVAVSPDGAVATGASQMTSAGITPPPDTFTFLPGETSARTSYAFGGYQTSLASNGLAWSADDSILAAVYGPFNGPYSLRVIDSPLLETSQLALAGPSGAAPNQPITLQGKLTFSVGAPPVGTPVTITRTQAGSDAAPATLNAVTQANGSFTVTDSPQPVGTYIYTASYTPASGTSASPASSTFTVPVTVATSSLSLTGPTSVRPGASFALSGNLAFQFGAPSNGQPVTVVRKNPNGTTASFRLTTGTNGAFKVNDKIPALGTYTYTASYAGGSAAKPAQPVTFRLTVAKASPTLTLSTSASTALYNSTIKVTAHLGSTYSDRTVSVYYQLIGTSAKKLLKTAVVNSAGNLTLGYLATRNVVFSATFNGDAQYLSRSVSQRFNVGARVAMTNSGWFSTISNFGTTEHIYHHTGHVNFSVTVAPNKHGEHLNLVVEQFYGGSWTAVPAQTFSYTLDNSSRVAGYLTVAKVIGDHFRMEAVFVPSHDVTNVGSHGGWFYFTVGN